MLDQRDHSIIAQASAHDAAEIYAALLRNGTYTQFVDTDFEVIRQAIVEGTVDMVLALEERTQQTAVQNVQNAFPGAEPFPTPAMPPMPGPDVAQPVYAPQPVYEQPQPQYQPQPQPGYAPPPMQPPPIPQAPPAPGPGQCQKCGGAMYDNRADNARKRQLGFKLVADFKCKSNRDHVIWPPDYQQYAGRPTEPR